MHRAWDKSRRCALRGRPFGIQCSCETDGLTIRLLQKFPKGLTLILSLSSVAPQAVKDAAAYFSPVVTIHLPSDDLSKPNSTETSKFIEIVN
ncbi:phosphoglycerate mutase [Colletotrichum tofieldiae]|nr:phosphoglycerate mutase [Colletotrichum tofieldiae]